jgi:hypothetical protein
MTFTVGTMEPDWSKCTLVETGSRGLVEARHRECRRWSQLLLLMLARYFEAQRPCPDCQARFSKLCDGKWGTEMIEGKQ